MSTSSFPHPISDLAELAQLNLQRAYEFLGAKPCKGILDVVILPTVPMSCKWKLEGISKAGQSFVDKFYPDKWVVNNRKLAQLRAELMEWRMEFKIKFPVESIEP